MSAKRLLQSAGVLLLCSSVAAAQDTVLVSLDMPLTVTTPVAVGSTQADLEIPVPAGVSSGRFEFIVPTEGASLSVRNPAGAVIFTSGDPTVQYESGASFGLPGGVFSIGGIAAPSPGTWRASLTFPAAATATAIMATAFLQNEVKAGIVVERTTFMAGEVSAVGIVLVSRNGETLPATSLLAAPTLRVEPLSGGAGIALSATDDGVLPDGQAGDGVFTANHTFGAPGAYRVVGAANVVSSNGVLTKTAERTITVVAPSIRLDNLNTTVTSGPAGCTAALAVNFGTTVTGPGEFMFRAVLRGSNGRELVVPRRLSLATGSPVVPLDVPFANIVSEIGVDGPYSVSEAQITEYRDNLPGQPKNESFVLAYRGRDVGSTPAVPVASGCVGAVSLESALDTTLTLTEGFISSVNLSFPVTVNRAGSYALSFKIIGPNGQDVQLVTGSRILVVGRNTVTFAVDRAAFLAVDGPYSVISLLVNGPAGAASLTTVGSTPALLRWQFRPRVAGDLDNDGDVDATDRNTLLLYRNQPALVPGDRRDLNKDGLIDLGDTRAILALTCSIATCVVR